MSGLVSDIRAGLLPIFLTSKGSPGKAVSSCWPARTPFVQSVPKNLVLGCPMFRNVPCLLCPLHGRRE